MTKYLVEAGAFRDDPVTIVDVGARWGINSEWKIFGGALRAYCFEPDRVECERLNASGDPNVTYIPAALGRRNEDATLYETKLGASTGLYRTNMDYFSRLLNRDNAQVVKEHRIEVTTLDAAMVDHGVATIDFLKLDVEGAELDVLIGAQRFLQGNDLLGILSEFRFQEEINGCPIFWELDSHVRKSGFRLFDMQYTHQSRRALPYAGLADYRLPNGDKFFAYTTHGQIMDGDALYFRDLLIAANGKMRAAATPSRLLKAAAFFEIYSLNDCAAELILANRETLCRQVNCDVLMDLLTPTLRGNRVNYETYMKAYFDPGSTVVAESAPLTSQRALGSKGKGILRRLLGR